jgi:hypothetical protein
MASGGRLSMKFVSNAGTGRVLDLGRSWLKPGHGMDMISPSFSLLAFSEALADGGTMSGLRLHGIAQVRSS